jgi:hypothetical protein
MIIPLFIIVPKRLDLYCQTNIARRDLVILHEKKQRNYGRNIIAIIVLLLSLLFSQLPSPLFIPEPLESEIPAKYLDHEPKALDPPATEPKPNTRVSNSPRGF